MADVTPVVLCMTASSEALAERVAMAIGGVVHGRQDRTTASIQFSETTEHIRTLFVSGIPVIGLCAAGILIRSVASSLDDKRTEPPLLALAEDGSSVIPLLGGHRGANRLARQIADHLGIAAAVTTAGDINLGVALDEPPRGWRLHNPDDAKSAMTALLSGAGLTIEGNGPFEALSERSGHPEITLTATVAAAMPRPNQLIYHPQTITLGVGCARGCPSEELSILVHEALDKAGLDRASIAGVYSLDLKADEAAVLDLAGELDVEARFFDAASLEAETPRLANPSDVVFAEVGCHGVSEGAALAAAGPDGVLLSEKVKSANATVAIAQAKAPVIQQPGRARGRVSLVGIGPGQAKWRAPEAGQIIAKADELVGYGFYIDLLGPLAASKARADFALGDEEARCRYALEEAGKGRDIAVICSGDAGIYAMGALVYELMSRNENGVSDAARRVDVVSVPGISALQAAAARIGAPLGHDFCAISLSDLLTPREDIVRRLTAAAQGDFVIAFYNPVSKRRRDLFVNAIDILSQHRPPNTPVVVASNLGRKGENVVLRRLDTVHVDEIDMMTVVLVGSSQSRLVRVGGRERMFTPRGYARKHATASA